MTHCYNYLQIYFFVRVTSKYGYLLSGLKCFQRASLLPARATQRRLALGVADHCLQASAWWRGHAHTSCTKAGLRLGRSPSHSSRCGSSVEFQLISG